MPVGAGIGLLAGSTIYSATQKPSTPAPLDPNQIGTSSLKTQLKLAPQVLDAAQKYQPQYIGLQQQNIQQQLYGSNGTSGLLDYYQSLGPSLASSARAAYDAANPNLVAANNGVAQSIANAQGNKVGATLTTAPSTGITAPYSSANFTAAYSPQLGPAAMINPAAVNRGTLAPQLEQDASARLAAAGRLSPEDQRSIAQGVIGNYGDRGLIDSAGSIADQAVNTSALIQSRQQQAQQYAGNVASLSAGYNLSDASARNAALTANAGAANNFALQRYGTGASLAQFNAGQANTLGTFNAGQANTLADQNANRALSLGTYNTGQANALAQFNAQLALQQQQQGISNQFGLAQLYQSQAINPTQLTSNLLTQAQQLGSGNAPTFDPFNASISSIYNTNYNAANAAAIAAGNNNAALGGAGLGAAAKLGAAFYG